MTRATRSCAYLHYPRFQQLILCHSVLPGSQQSSSDEAGMSMCRLNFLESSTPASALRSRLTRTLGRLKTAERERYGERAVGMPVLRIGALRANHDESAVRDRPVFAQKPVSGPAISSRKFSLAPFPDRIVHQRPLAARISIHDVPLFFVL